ncbi:MAG: hypothetical protein A3F31_00930 [Candidatus Levybacteria bacterium RIFCSPHIGHO2_12_FULL_38_12]|nr:MAG: hypothetical protein A2770_01560 [Candidatus Levybacteria bacterium RIFCSPHIGHO2_01_FULL_38_12]OGH21984.1 MAG: hypothetical protein A3D75_03090 [Candidatus Levybacteria bacterium RIFCSPHIGHO2_02_FULL_37_18]OGH23055.1 MAG: hypothetical protein A3F31_00930 [Candidatus Levybacteria bacterium RIFCSPHIGHO2_12_FULL_38_12]OGH33677.1 MAG: hypothetical protein A3A47_02525 [Candidatus Levybacteria bacterium RIFCSPLOWO2_01_FULL_37_20]OGH44583.1 MAG: hypothetical protein A3J14_00610 [Candidatus Lev
MTKLYYKKSNKKNLKIIIRIVSIGIFLAGLYVLSYVFLPIYSWHIYFAPVFAAQNVNYPIPKLLLLTPTSNTSIDTKYLDAKNWFPTLSTTDTAPKISSYTLSIPKLSIKNALVSTINNDLSKHLVHYQGTALPPDNGNAVIFGHSTLPQLFNPKDYTTIFARAYTLSNYDKIILQMQGITYTYSIYNTTVVNPTDTSPFNQDYAFSHLTLVTCTPPGTTWKRLIIKAKIENL